MYRYNLVFNLVLLFGVVNPVLADAGKITIIPEPMKMNVGEGKFTITPKTAIVVTEDTRCIGQYLAELLATATGFALDVKQISPSQRDSSCVILLNVSAKNDLGPEGYDLKVTANRISANAPTPAGVFYACQTIRQLLPVDIESKEKIQDINWIIPQVEIEDKPRFPWRGLMLDPSRRFWNVEFIKRYIDLLALYKVNVLHLHLTDDQGWRVEIKKYPKLTTIGAKVAERHKEAAQPYPGANGFYTQDDIREIVRYAASRYVTVVPEIDLPGHSMAILASYPELSCSGKEGYYEVFPALESMRAIIIGHKDVSLCAGKEKTFEFLQDVLSEVIELFPSPYIHIGGDEQDASSWETCPLCQAKIKSEGLEKQDCEELQKLYADSETGKRKYLLYRYFMRRLCDFLTSKGRRAVMWDDIAWHGQFPQGAIIQQWHYKGSKDKTHNIKLSESPAVEAARAGNDVVCSSGQAFYFDFTHKNYPFRVTYRFEPVPKELTDEQAKHILGAMGCMWTDVRATLEKVDSQVFPRLLALSEVTWSPKEKRNLEDFIDRLETHYKRLDKLGVKYYSGGTQAEDANQPSTQ